MTDSFSHRHVFTPGGFRRLQRRIAEARAAWKAVCDDNPAALESGDTSGWHDNFAFEDNLRQLHQLGRRVRDLERVAGLAEIVPPLRAAPERVVVGATVRLAEDDGDERLVWIAGYDDGDPPAGRISYNSPLGRVLIGAEAGDVRVLRVEGRERRLEVVDLGPSPVGEGEA